MLSGTRLLKTATEGYHSNRNLVNNWEIGDSVVVVYSYGSPPIQLNHDHWRAAGVNLGQIIPGEDVHWLFDSSEADPEIEYWPSTTKLNIVQETFLYDEGRFVPFARHEFDLSITPAPSRVELLLAPDPSLVREIPNIVQQLQSIEYEDNGDRLYKLLFQLWKAGLSEPVRICKELRQLSGSSWYDGGNAEAVISMTKELSLVQRIQTQI